MSVRCFLNLKSLTKGVLFCGAAAFVASSHGDVIKAKSLSQSEVQSAVNSASPGDTVVLPSGTQSWSGQLRIEKKNITIKGAGAGSTIINAGSKTIYLSGESASGLRITGIEFRSGNQVIYASGSGSPKQAVKNLRVDHCKFQGNYIVIETTGGATGVFDHNEFLNSYAARLYGSNDPNPRPPYPLGTSDALFFEDNIITANSSGNPPHWIASNSHSKYVVRHNKFNYSKSLWDIVDAHGACEVKGRGSATWEIYNNVFNICPTISRVIHLRGGQGVVFNNTFKGYNAGKAITITDYALCNGSCTQSCTKLPCPDLINHAYFWNNILEGKAINPVNSCSDYIKLDKDYFTYEMPGYKPYTYPHPLTKEPDNATGILRKESAPISAISLTARMSDGLAQISFSLKDEAPVKMAIYNANGVLVKELIDEVKTAGNHSISWDATNIPAGLYIVRATAGKLQESFTFMR